MNEQKYEITKKLKKEDKNYIYLETHHILPRSLGGKDTKENLVNLTAREHFLAHLLYEKYLKTFTVKTQFSTMR